MNSGYLRKRILIQYPVQSRGTNGEELRTMQPYFFRWGSMKALSGSESQVAGIQTQAIQSWSVRLRYEPKLSGMEADWEIVVDGKTYRLIAPPDNVMGLNRELVLKVAQIGE